MLRHVVSASLIYGLASVVSKGITLLLLPIYTRVLTVGDFGAFDMIMTVAALASLTVALEISQGLARHWAETPADQRPRLAGTALWFTVAMNGVFLTAGLIWSRDLAQALLGSQTHLAAVRIGLVFMAASGVLAFLTAQFRWEQRSRDYALVSLTHAGLTLILALAFCLGLGWGLDGVMASLLASTLAAAAIAWRMLRASFAPGMDRAWLRRMLAFSLPLVPAGLGTFTSLYLNRFVLGTYGTLQDVGLFGAASRIAGLVVLLVMGVQLALTPLVYEHHREPGTPAQIARLASAFLAVALVACLALGLLAPELIRVFATPAYLAATPLVAILAPALLMAQMYVFAPGIGIARRTWWQLWIVLASALAGLALNLLLVPPMGAMGAALATLGATLVFLALWIAASQRLYRVPYQTMRCGLAVALFALLLGAGHLPGVASGDALALAARLGLIGAMIIGVLALRLISMSDLRKLVAR